jgi:hypothetical protein
LTCESSSKVWRLHRSWSVGVQCLAVAPAELHMHHANREMSSDHVSQGTLRASSPSSLPTHPNGHPSMGHEGCAHLCSNRSGPQWHIAIELVGGDGA